MFAAVSSTSRHLRGIAQRVILPALVLTYAVNTFFAPQWGTHAGQQRAVAPEEAASHVRSPGPRAHGQQVSAEKISQRSRRPEPTVRPAPSPRPSRPPSADRAPA